MQRILRNVLSSKQRNLIELLRLSFKNYALVWNDSEIVNPFGRDWFYAIYQHRRSI